MRKEIGYYIKSIYYNKKRELNSMEIYEAFREKYENKDNHIKLIDYNISNEEDTKIIQKKDRMGI